MLVRLASFVAGLAVVVGAWPAVAWGQETVTARVTRVVDGDTVIARFADRAESPVRLIGIDTPECVKPGTPVECGARAAAQTLRYLVEG